MKPRHLYLILFTYYALSGGRFTAPFLEHQLGLNQNWMIGSALALQILVGSVGSSYFGILADKWDARRSVGGTRGCRGRLIIMFGGLVVSTVATLLHGVASMVLWNTDDTTVGRSESASLPIAILVYHLVLRCIYALGISATSPVLNGLTLARLQRDGRDSNEFGKERLYGAISWGVANAFFGVAIDSWGFFIVYLTSILSFVACSVGFYLYAKADDARSLSEDQRSTGETDDRPVQDETKSIDESLGLVHLQNDDSQQFNEEKKFSDEDYSMHKKSNQFNNNTNDESPPKQFTFSFLFQTISNQQTPLLNISYIIALFTLYIGMSVVENLIFLYFEFLGGSNSLCGLTVAVTVLFELPIFHFAPNILKRMKSPVWMFQLGCLAYVVRVIGYSMIPESHAPWVLLFEPLHGVTIGFVLTGSVAFVDSLMPKGYESSGQGFLSTVMGLGQFVGLCIGGLLEGRVLYRVLAGIVSLGGIILAVGYHLSMRSRLDETGSTNDVQLQRVNVKAVKRKRSDVIERTGYAQVAKPDILGNVRGDIEIL
ncbi:hypothetical protein HJC23_000264 [Cyclotella cryptica]|uniref:Major facilitator superfamily associated domain-containing protein n=1 Tax=Cyclotella cryptica TaxID=29204 RepID=A0ABD3QCC2_9STRA|eukprot:CCRYP_006840-RA/>CCRYP_006840-RA protein AED:0.00 eAED:0.00 QI:177/-1/1/1/-1/1/1/76/541